MSWQTRTRIRRADIHQDGLTARSLASCSRIGRHSLMSGSRAISVARARARSVTAGSSNTWSSAAGSSETAAKPPGSWMPAFTDATRSALLTWSEENSGMRTCGTPAATAAIVVPNPPCPMTAAAPTRRFPWGHRPVFRLLRRVG